MAKPKPKSKLTKGQRILVSLVPLLAVMAVLSSVYVIHYRNQVSQRNLQRRAQVLGLPLSERARGILDDAETYIRTGTPDDETLERIRDSVGRSQELATYAMRLIPEEQEGAQVPQAEQVFRIRGRGLELMYQFAAARTDYETAVGFHPESPARFHLGILGTRELARARLVELETSTATHDELKDLSSEPLRRFQAFSEEMNIKLDAEVGSMTGTIDFGIKNLCALCNAYAYEEYEKVATFARVVEGFNSTHWIVPYVDGLASYHLALSAEKEKTRDEYLLEAETSLRLAVRRSPVTADSYAWLAKVLARRGDTADALRMLTLAITINPNFLEAYYLRGTLRFEEKLFEDARADFSACTKLLPDKPELHLKHGIASLEFWRRAGRATPEDLNAAESAFTLYLAAKPDDAAALVHRAEVRIGREEPGKALEDLKQALDLRAEFLDAYTVRARVYESMKAWAKAEADYGAVLERAAGAEADRARLARARVRAAGGRIDPALEDFDALLERDPSPGTLMEKARVLLVADRLDAALAATEKALEISRTNARVMTLRAEIFLAQDNLDAALREADRAFRQDPQQAEALVVRGRVHLEKGDRVKASADLKRALEIRPDLKPLIAPLLEGE